MRKATKPGADYYAGGHRIMLGGVPCRVAREPGPTGLKLMRETARGFASATHRPMRQLDGSTRYKSNVSGLYQEEAFMIALGIERREFLAMQKRHRAILDAPLLVQLDIAA